MLIRKETLEQIKNVLSLSDVISSYISLSNAGVRRYKGLCPFHNEKTPSFIVDDSKGSYYCFGCQASGDVFTFIQEQEKLEFIDTVKLLAKKASVIIPENNQKKSNDLYEQIYHTMELATNFFIESLHNLRPGLDNIALSYLKKRGVKKEMIQKFRIGYAGNSWDALKNHLTQKGVSLDVLEISGLVRKKNNKCYDYFRDRIIFPIMDKKNRVIAFGGRAISEDSQPKYLNSPETPIFKKKDVLYGINFCANHCDQLILVEGYMDVIALAQENINYAVAPLGTAVTNDHILKIWSYCANPIVCFDGDKAGLSAMYKLVKAILPVLKIDYNLRFVQLPDALDPDSFLQKYDKNKLLEYFSRSDVISEFLWKMGLKKYDIKTAEDIASLENMFMILANSVVNKILSKNYVKFFHNQLFALKGNRLTSYSKSHKGLASDIKNYQPKKLSYHFYEFKILVIIYLFPDLIWRNDNIKNFEELNFFDPICIKIQQFICAFVGRYINDLDLENRNYTDWSKGLIKELNDNFSDMHQRIQSEYKQITILKSYNKVRAQQLYDTSLLEYQMHLILMEREYISGNLYNIAEMEDHELYMSEKARIDMLDSEISYLKSQLHDYEEG